MDCGSERVKNKRSRIMIEPFHELIFLIETYPSHTTKQCFYGETQEIATIEGRKGKKEVGFSLKADFYESDDSK